MLTEEMVPPDRIAILSNDKLLIHKLRQNYAGDIPFTSYGKFGVVCETVKRFKGLECDILVLAMVDELPTIKLEEFYVGMSRAKSGLFVLGSESTKKRLKWFGKKTC